MQQLKKLYRSNYAGENVVTSLSLSNNEWAPETEYLPNSVFNTFTTTQAIAIGNGESRLGFDLTHIANHKAGLGGSNRLQSYGCNALYRDFTPDFLVAVGDEMVKELTTSNYCKDNIVYANGEHLIEYPGNFYLVPQNVPYDAGALAVYLACFDGHKKIFLLGYDGYNGDEPVNNVYKDTNAYPMAIETQNHAYWAKTLSTVMSTYPEVEFIRVMPVASWAIPPAYSNLINFRQISFRDFTIEADIG